MPLSADTIRHVPALASGPARIRPAEAAARAVMLALVAALTYAFTGSAAQLGWIALLAIAAAPPFLARGHAVYCHKVVLTRDGFWKKKAA